MSSIEPIEPMTATSVAVSPETLRRLKSYKIGGPSYDDVLNDLMDAQPPEEFIREHLRRLKSEERVGWVSVKKRNKL